MDRKYPVRIGSLLKAHLENSDSFIEGLKESTIMRSWQEVAGDEFSQYVSKLYIRERKLYVSFTSAVVKNAFVARRKEILYKLNGKVGEAYIRLIIVI